MSALYVEEWSFFLFLIRMKKRFCLKKNQDIEKLVKLRKSVGNRFYVIYYNDTNETKVAISVSKKLGNAVVRNYQKRVIREIVSKQLIKLKNKHILIVVKTNSLVLKFDEKKNMINSLIKKINIKENGEK